MTKATTTPSPITRLTYSYHDAAGYKMASSIHLAGKLEPADLQAIKAKLAEGEFFIPTDQCLNIPELQDRLETFPSENDHVYHELDLGDIDVFAYAPPGVPVIDVQAFMAAFAAIENSDSSNEAAAQARLGL